MNRRQAITSMASGGVLAFTAAGRSIAETKTGRLKQGVCYWTYRKWFTLEDLCKEAKRIGLQGIDLVTPDQYVTVQKYGLTPSMTAGAPPNTIKIGLNRVENHETVLSSLKNDITLASAAKVPNVITFSGNRGGMPDAEGLITRYLAVRRLSANHPPLASTAPTVPPLLRRRMSPTNSVVDVSCGS